LLKKGNSGGGLTSNKKALDPTWYGTEAAENVSISWIGRFGTRRTSVDRDMALLGIN
jgi:hypothetical protein